MKVPLSWLSEYVTVPASEKELGDKLTAVGHMQDGPIKDVAGDRVLDLEIRQNRSDCLSLLGVAREVAAVTGGKLLMPAGLDQKLQPSAPGIDARIADDELCYRFNSVTVTGVKPAQSPEWLRQRLDAYGIKTINTVVDVTNYVMVELGRPLHAFDARHIAQGQLVVRAAQEGEKLVVIGGKELRLTADDIVIADPEKVLALAGIIGGEHSGVSDQTTEVVIEAAAFNQASIRRSSMRHATRTEASTRLEKFLHPHLTELALRRAWYLLKELHPEAELTGTTDIYPSPMADTIIELSLETVRRVGGIDITQDKIHEYLDALEIPNEKYNLVHLKVTVPYFRTDIEQEADVVEEILRIHGYDAIPERLPHLPVPASITSKGYEVEEKARDVLVGLGFDEQITEPLVHEEQPVSEPVILENSLTSEKDMLRTSLVPQLEKAVITRQKFRQSDIRVFEVGKVYFVKDAAYQEARQVGLIWAGKEASYRRLKGVVEALLVKLGYAPEERLYEVKPVKVGSLVAYVAVVYLEQLVSQEASPQTEVLTSPPQVILEDFSLKVPAEVAVGELLKGVRGLNPLIYKVELGEDPRLVDGQHSLFINVTYHQAGKTLSMEDTKPVHDQILEHLKSQFGAELRA